MKCPFCGHQEDKVLESRQNTSGTTIRRRRSCLGCGYRFTSYEHIEDVPLMVVKRDGRRQGFDLKKIERGVMRAIEKRPIAQLDVEKLLHEIEDHANLTGRASHEIDSETLGEMVLEHLFKLDRVAYVRFVSVYWKFEEVDEFIRVVENLSPKTLGNKKKRSNSGKERGDKLETIPGE